MAAATTPPSEDSKYSHLNYTDRQKALQKEKRKGIESASQLVISNLAVEGYFKEIQCIVIEDSDCALFKMDIPLAVIHLCYRFCREFKDYLILLMDKSPLIRPPNAPSYYSPKPDNIHKEEIKLFSIKQFANHYGIRLSNAQKHLVHFANPDQELKGSNGCHRGMCFIPHLNVSKAVKQKMNVTNGRSVHCGILRMKQVQWSSRSNPSNGLDSLSLIHFESPYFTKYESADSGNTYPFGHFAISNVEDNANTNNNSSGRNSWQSFCHIPDGNVVVAFKRKYVYVLDLYDMKWLNPRKNYGTIKMQKEREFQSVCNMNNRLFVIGGRGPINDRFGTSNNIEYIDTVETLDWTKIDEMDWDQKIQSDQFAVSTSTMKATLNIPRYNHGCDIMNAQGGRLVIGGGRSADDLRNINLRNSKVALNRIEMFDPQKDEWILHEAKTEQIYRKAKLWCSGHLIFMAQNEGGPLGSMERIEFLDIREKGDWKWDVLDDKRVEKLYDLYSTKHKFMYYNQGLFF